MFDKNICRLCVEKIPIDNALKLSNSSTLEVNIEYKISYCFRIEINQTDKHFPNYICKQCKDKLDFTFDFICQVEKAQKFLNDELNKASHIQSTVPNSKKCDSEDISSIQTFVEFSHINDSNEEIEVQRESKLEMERDLLILDETNKTKENIETSKQKWREKRSKTLIKYFREWKSYKWKCQDCTVECLNVKDFRKHYTDIHNKSPVYTCNECNKVLCKYEVFQKHVRNHRNCHKYCCEICGKFSYNKEHHERHKETHSNERKFMCSICGKNFKTSCSLKNHEKLHLPPELREQFECDICHKKLASQPSLWAHKKLHTGIKEFSCNICGKVFAQKTNLMQHTSLHSETAPFQCTLCPRTFKTARRLKRHEIIHTNLKPFECDNCGKQFRTKQTLNDHKVIHSDFFPYECEYCQKRFKLKQLLKVHFRQHTGERPYECVDCDHRFANWSNYNKHMKGRHGTNMTSPITQLIHAQRQQL